MSGFKDEVLANFWELEILVIFLTSHNANLEDSDKF
jgi:hypothetical protein